MHATASKAPAQADSAKAEAESKKNAALIEGPSQIPLWAQGVTPGALSGVQFSLKVGGVDDPSEREAEQVAEQVMRMPQPAAQRDEQGMQEEEEALAQKGKKGGEAAPLDEPQIKRKPVADAKGDSQNGSPLRSLYGQMNGSTLEQRIGAVRGGGRPLRGAERAFFEPRFGRDFGAVRVHTGGDAADLASSLQARAFTLGNTIVFNRGEYAFGSGKGRNLMAHELTHVVQQSGQLRPRHIQRAPAEEAKKYDEIDYKKARVENLNSWYEQYKFFNLFHEERIYPGSNPITYANRVYELQVTLEALLDGKWEIPEPGILEAKVTNMSTLGLLIAAAITYQKDPSVDFGLNKEMLQRIYRYYEASEENAPPLTSRYFATIRQLEAVNRNRLFYIGPGDRGDYVVRIQLALLALNYDLGKDVTVDKDTKESQVTGIYGKGTKKAVVNFQKDSGLEGKDVDGLVGQMTLRLLDKRVGAPVFKQRGGGSGDAYLFYVPVTAADLQLNSAEAQKVLMLRTLKIAFPISDEQIDILLRSGWGWVFFNEVTQADVDQGHYKAAITRSAYEGVMGEVAKQSGGKPQAPVEETLERQTIELLKGSKLQELNKRIRDLEKTINAMRWSGDPEMHGRDVPWDEINKKQAELDTLKQQRQEELNRLGITLDEFEKLKTDFINTFERFAVRIALQMLSENEIQANIEAQHYANMQEVAAIKKVLSDLSAKYGQSEALWWEAVSLEHTKGKDKEYYSSSQEYIRKNSETRTMRGEQFEVFVGDRTRLYSEKNVAAMYKALESKPNAYYAPWKAKEKEVVDTLKGATEKFPILAYPKLSLRANAGRYAGKPDEELQKMLLEIIKGNDDKKGIKENIEATRKALASEPEKIWELPVVVLRAQYELGLVDGLPVELIKQKQEDVADKGFWESIGLAILGIGLGLLALVSGPVGWLALAASIGVGAYDAYRTYQDITFKKETAGSSIDPATALGTEDPSYFWFWVSLISVGLDVVQAAKLVKAVGKGIELTEGVTRGLKEARAVAELKLAEAGEATAKGKEILKEIEEIDQALAKVSSREFIENHKLLAPLKDNPLAVTVMNEALRDKKIVQAITALGKTVDKELFENALKFYAGVGRKSLDELPELMRLVKAGGLEANKRLITELLSDPRAQRALLDTQDPGLIAGHFKKWEEAIKAGESQSFVKYLESQNLTTKLADDTKLADMFGEAFATLPNAVKNRQILRTVEPRLLDALNAGTLSPEISKALDVLLNSDILAHSTRLGSAQERLLRELQLIGGLIETQSDFAKVVALLDNPTSRRALWEGATQLAGKEKYTEIILKANGGQRPTAEVMDDLIRIGPMTDEGTVRSLIASDEVRKALAANPAAVAVLKKCASPCLPPFVTRAQISRVATIMEGKSGDDVLRIREFLYANRSSKDTFEAALKSMETNFDEALKDVKLPVLTKPPKFDVPAQVLRDITDLGLPISVLNEIIAKAARVAGGDAILLDLRRVLQFEKSVKLQNFDKLVTGLAKGDAAEFRAARHLLDEAERFVGGGPFKYNGLQKADVLLGRFTLTELNTLMGARWSEGFVNTLYEATLKLDGLTNDEILSLVKKAGGGRAPGDLGRLQDILSTMKATAVSFDEAAKAIEAADAFAASVAKAMRDPRTGFEATARLIWGEAVKIEDDVVKVTELLGKSGSDAYQTVFKLGQGDAIAKTIVSGGAINKESWKVFRKAVQNADIATGIKNSIIGEMWTRVHVEYYKNLGYKVYRELQLTTGRTIAKADIVLVKGNEIIIVECKSGGAVFSAGQEVVYPLLQQSKFKSVMIKGDEALVKKYANPKTKISFVPRRESELITP